ncbi:MAG: DUF167 domain-containing protein [Candidatus Portnoybacteria bacterium]|jgi:hypothetical protein|nr:DUF167 domain-containing protein [Candidatus Portnoybacteria bacterium]
MKIFVKVKPAAKRQGVKRISDTNFSVAVTAPPEKGKANKAVILALAEYLKIAPSRIKILLGSTSKNKILEII